MIYKQQKQIEKLAMTLIDATIKNSLLNLISDVCIGIEDIKHKDVSKTFEFVNELKKNIFDYTLEIKEIIKSPLEERQEHQEKLKSFKTSLLEYYNSTFLCILYLQRKQEYTLLKYFETNTNNINIPPYNDKNIINICMNYVSSDENNMANVMNMSKILSLIPLKMTKSKYYDYIKKSLEIMFSAGSKDLLDSLAETLKYKFAPFEFENLKKYHADTIEEIDRLIELYPEALSSKKENTIQRNIDKLLLKLDSLMVSCSVVYNDINYLLNIVSFCFDEQYLFNDDLIFKDLYYSTCNAIKSHENIFLLDNVLKDTQIRIENLSDEIKTLETSYFKLISALEGTKLTSLPENVYINFSIQRVVYNNFYDEICIIPVDSFKEGDDKKASKEYINEKIQELISFIDNVVKTTDKSTGKYLKQIFFEYIVCPFKYPEFAELLSFYIESLRGSNLEKPIILRILNHINFKKSSNIVNLTEFDKYIPYEIENDCDCEHEHHHH